MLGWQFPISSENIRGKAERDEITGLLSSRDLENLFDGLFIEPHEVPDSISLKSFVFYRNHIEVFPGDSDFAQPGREPDRLVEVFQPAYSFQRGLLGIMEGFVDAILPAEIGALVHKAQSRVRLHPSKLEERHARSSQGADNPVTETRFFDAPSAKMDKDPLAPLFRFGSDELFRIPAKNDRRRIEESKVFHACPPG
jgi:hypothetical protein